MLNQFNNLPGVYVYKDDGNLKVIDTIPGNVAVVLGTAPDGPGSIYLVQDTASAEALFDPGLTKEGTLIKGMFEAIESGAPFVALKRIGSSPVALDFVNGYTIIINDASASADSEYRLYYTNDFSGQEVIRVLDATTNAILYDSITGVNIGGITVLGSQVNANTADGGVDITIGDGTSASPTFAALQDFTQATGDIGADITGVTITNATKQITTTDASVKAGMIIELTSATDAADDGFYIVEYVEPGTPNIINLASKVTFTNGVMVVDDTWTALAAVGATDGVVTIKLRSIPAGLGLSLTNDELYAELASAYWELETAQVDMVLPQGVYLDTPNVVDNEGKLPYDAGYAAPSSGDFLSKFYEFIHNGQVFFATKNAFSSGSDITAVALPSPYDLGIDGFAAKAWLEGTHIFEDAYICTSDADVIALEDNITYGEANFGHQLATYCNDLSTNDNEASGVVQMAPPVNYAAASISVWIGKEPTFDSAGETMIRSGSGILGYKHIAGSLGVAKGFFATGSGLVDGTPVLDRNSQAIDIGRYLDVVSNPVLLKSVYEGSSTGYIAGAGVYGGLLMSLKPNLSTTNVKFKSNVTLPFSLARKYLDSIVAAGYVVFASAVDNSVKVVDAPTAALSTSDWKRRLTNRITGAVVEAVRAVAEPYIGKITDANIMLSLQDELNSLLKEFATPIDQYLIGGLARVKQTRDMAIRGEAAIQLQLRVPGENRRITVYVSLTK